MQLLQIYIDDIIFDETNECLCKDFSNMMQTNFEMAMMGEIWNILELKIHQSKEATFRYQAKYCKKFIKISEWKK